MQYRKMPLVTDGAKKAELARVIEDINRTLQTHTALVQKRGIAYAQAIADEAFERLLGHHRYRVTCKMSAAGVIIDLEEPICDVALEN